MSVTADTNGGLTLFALDPSGQIWGRTQYIGANGSNGGGTWSPWGQLNGWLSTITAQTNGNGLIELFGANYDTGTVYQRWELTHNTGSWSTWNFFDISLSPPSTITATTIGAGGAVVVYGTDSGARIWGRTAYIGPNGNNGGGSWSPWGPIDGALTGITATGDPDGRIELFGVNSFGNLFHRKELTAGTGDWGRGNWWTARTRDAPHNQRLSPVS